MSKKKWILVGIGLLVLGVVVGLVPASESYSDYGLWSDEGAVDVECGSLFARDVRADFADWEEQQDYDQEVSWYGEPAIFEGQTASQVCGDQLGDRKAAVIFLMIAGAVAFVIGLTRKQPVWNDGTAPVGGGTGSAVVVPPAPPAQPAAEVVEPPAVVDRPPEAPVDVTVPKAIDPNGELQHQKAYQVVFDNGEVAGLDVPLVVGRDPAPYAEAPVARLHALVDQTRTISKTHLTLIPEGDRVWVIDRNSTNGTLVVDDGDESRVEPGVRTPVAPGQTIKFGDRTLTIIGGE